MGNVWHCRVLVPPQNLCYVKFFVNSKIVTELWKFTWISWIMYAYTVISHFNIILKFHKIMQWQRETILSLSVWRYAINPRCDNPTSFTLTSAISLLFELDQKFKVQRNLHIQEHICTKYRSEIPCMLITIYIVSWNAFSLSHPVRLPAQEFHKDWAAC